jgi:hypothetical protein
MFTVLREKTKVPCPKEEEHPPQTFFGLELASSTLS